MRSTLLFDMDGTLLRCSEYYRKAIEQFGHLKAARGTITPGAASKVLSEIDLAATTLPDAFKRHRFPLSFRAASFAVDVISGNSISFAEAVEAYNIGDAVFDAEYEPYPEALNTVLAYKQAGWHLVLVTKGDHEVQWSKIKKRGLNWLFGEENVYVTLAKSADLLQSIVAEQEIDSDSSFVIGDSLKDDIAPATAIGLRTVLIESDHPWSYNDHDVTPTHVLPAVSAMPNVVPIGAICHPVT